ncbi:MAG: cytochrome c [Gammaproteobacteria bacterium]|nr:cytochrome c [Gammaproteobacteria bacterium]
MSENFTKSMARNMFYGGAVFFFLLFVGLTFDTMRELPKRDHRENITPEVAQGKLLWEENDCIGCHTLLGEGAYFAPELGNVYTRFGKNKQAIMAFIKSRPVDGIEGRRSMPQFNFSDEQLNDIAEFLKWTSEINSAGWPPNIQG